MHCKVDDHRMCHISDRGDRVNPIRIESCESFRMRAEVFISECLAITNDSNGMTRKAVAIGACRIAKEDILTNLADLFTKVLPKHRQEYNLNKFTY